jgi:hypothetical protein
VRVRVRVLSASRESRDFETKKVGGQLKLLVLYARQPFCGLRQYSRIGD